MARDEQQQQHPTEAPRRGRPKRSANPTATTSMSAPPPPSNPKSRMEMMLAAVTTAEAASAPHPAATSVPHYHQPHPQHQQQQQFHPPPQVYQQYQSYQQPPQYQPSQHYPPQQQQSMDRADVQTDKVKRKRAKKSRDEDGWTAHSPMVAPAAASSESSTSSHHHNGMSIGSLVAPVAASSSSVHSISSLTGGPPPPEFTLPVASSGLHVQAPAAAPLSSILSSSASSSPSVPSSVFQAVPTIIQSFAETERRRTSGSGDGSANSSNASNSMNISILTHGNGKSSASSRGGKNDERGAAMSGRSHSQSILELFFPDATGKAGSNAAENGNREHTKSLKRKRRVDPALSSSSAASRSSRRAQEEALGGGTHGDYDMLRFGVDSTKLIPQGLVDRVDAKMSGAFISRLIQSHVENWTKKAGFGSNFLSEIATLLTAYYPCHYPTILDEVLACFLFKRPEFTDLLLKPMIDKLQKLGESATCAKYPVVDAFARNCWTDGASGVSELSRHDFACEVLLQCLLERNTEKFILSASIGACALNCSDVVLEKLWRGILNAWICESEEAETAKRLAKSDIRWVIMDPVQQAYELLQDEKIRLRGNNNDTTGGCRLATAFVRVVLLDAIYKEEAMIVSSTIMQQALELFFGHGSTSDSSALLLDRVRCLADNSDKEFAHLLKFLVNSTAKLSIKKTNWFLRHVLRFLLSNEHCMEERQALLSEVVSRYMPLLLGGIEKDEVQNQESSTKENEESSKATENGDPLLGKKSKHLFSKQLHWDVLEHVEKHSVEDTIEKLENLLATLDTSHHTHAAAFLEKWTAGWSPRSDRVAVPWSYVNAMILVAVDEKCVDRYRNVFKSFQCLVTRTCGAYFRQSASQLSAAPNAAVAINRFTEALHVLLSSSSEFARTLLRNVVDALRLLEASSKGSIFTNAVTVRLREGKRDEEWKAAFPVSGKRSGAQKSVVGYAATSGSLRSGVELQVLVSLVDLASLGDATGEFVRAQLSCRSTVRLLTALMHDVCTSRLKMLKLIDLIDAVVSRRHDREDALTKEWTRQHIVQQIVECAYRVGTLTTADRLVGLLHNIAQQNLGESGGDATLLWVILRQCTKFCCGCTQGAGDDHVQRLGAVRFHTTATGSFAELVKVMLRATPSSALRGVVGFIEQELCSCRSKDTRMNLFLLLLLQKVAIVERQPRSYIAAIQIAVFSIGATTRDHIRIMQLQLLKALCSRLVVVRNQDVAVRSKNAVLADDCRACEEVVCNERLQSDLRTIVASSVATGADGVTSNGSSSRASIVLAEGILKFAAEMTRNQRARTVGR